MNRLVKRLSGPISRLMSRHLKSSVNPIDARVIELVVGSVNEKVHNDIVGPLAVALQKLERIEGSLARAEGAATSLSEEVDLVLNGLSREIFRLQAQVEQLQSTLARDPRFVQGGLSLLDPSGNESPILRQSLTERSRVG